MATRQTISRISARIDELAVRLGVSPRPLYCVCGTIEEGEQAVARHLAEHPRDGERAIHIIATGVPRGGLHGPTTVWEWPR
jgi:hypothetical protein